MWLAFTMAVFFSQIICTFIKLIFVIFASVEISVRDKMGCWNEVIMKNFAWNENHVLHKLYSCTVSVISRLEQKKDYLETTQ